MLILLIVLVLVFGGGGFFMGPGPYRTGGFSLVGFLLVVLLFWVVLGGGNILNLHSW